HPGVRTRRQEGQESWANGNGELKVEKGRMLTRHGVGNQRHKTICVLFNEKLICSVN
uniref:Uncharacterized protein n=1 Tax=Loxodonta africana TaxID=9785 RepID=G3TXM8_LOXAF